MLLKNHILHQSSMCVVSILQNEICFKSKMERKKKADILRLMLSALRSNLIITLFISISSAAEVACLKMNLF